MKRIRFPKFIGGRIFKTGIAVFFTALICEFFNWPVIFAVITAIVTIEPTASDSIKKGLIRLPASAIGAAFSMIFAFLIGDAALTYSLAAVFTIITCHRLKLDAGILVATLTAVNMIPTIHDHFFLNFLVRLGTTAIGLSVSTMVNLIILPPNYSRTINKNINKLMLDTSELIKCCFKDILDGSDNNRKDASCTLEQIIKEIDKTEELCRYQKEEWRYHRHTQSEENRFVKKQNQLKVLRQILFHLANLVYSPLEKIDWKEGQKEKVEEMVILIARALESGQAKDNVKVNMETIFKEFWDAGRTSTPTSQDHLPSKTIVLYELIIISNLVKEIDASENLEFHKLANTTFTIQKSQ